MSIELCSPSSLPQGTVTSDKFCCSLSADPSKCKPGAKDRFSNAGMVVIDKVV